MSNTWRQAVEPKPPKQSLSAWMAANGYRQAVVDSVAAGNCVKKLLDKFKTQRQTAAGPDGNLSRAQRAEYFGAREDASTAQAGRGSKPDRAGRGKKPAEHRARSSSARTGAPNAESEKRLAAANAAL